MKAHFEQFAAYNRWANARLYQAAFALSDTDYRRDVGAFFKSMHGTLNHLPVTDRIGLKRLTGEGDHPNQFDAIIHDDRRALAVARADEDDRIIRYVASLDEAMLDGLQEYKTTSSKPRPTLSYRSAPGAWQGRQHQPPIASRQDLPH
jgi:uncharacterized damage-inducible protein DinB